MYGGGVAGGGVGVWFGGVGFGGGIGVGVGVGPGHAEPTTILSMLKKLLGGGSPWQETVNEVIVTPSILRVTELPCAVTLFQIALHCRRVTRPRPIIRSFAIRNLDCMCYPIRRTKPRYIRR